MAKEWRRGPESNRRIEDLQSPALPLCYRAVRQVGESIDRAIFGQVKSPYPFFPITFLISKNLFTFPYFRIVERRNSDPMHLILTLAQIYYDH